MDDKNAKWFYWVNNNFKAKGDDIIISLLLNDSYNLTIFWLKEIPILKLSSNPFETSAYSSSNFSPF